MVRFFILFVVILAALFAAELTPPAQNAVVLPWTEALVRISSGLITLFDSQVATSGNILLSTTDGFAISIEAGCNGVEAAIILIAAMLAFPAPWKHRAIGILAGLAAVQALNIVRVISLFYLGQWNIKVFEWAHLYAWQALIMLDVLIGLADMDSDIAAGPIAGFARSPIGGGAASGGTMTAAVPSLGKLPCATFLWLPPCFAAWYFAAQYHAAAAGWLARLLVDWITPGAVSRLERPGLDLTFVTTLQVHSSPGQAALLLLEVNPLLYTYGLAFLLALMLAERARWWKILVGAAVLLPFQAWGIAFDFLLQVGVTLGPDVAAQAGLSGWRREAIALGYQAGSLIFPTLMPVVIWAASSPLFTESVSRPPGAVPPRPDLDTPLSEAQRETRRAAG